LKDANNSNVKGVPRHAKSGPLEHEKTSDEAKHLAAHMALVITLPCAFITAHTYHPTYPHQSPNASCRGISSGAVSIASPLELRGTTTRVGEACEECEECEWLGLGRGGAAESAMGTRPLTDDGRWQPDEVCSNTSKGTGMNMMGSCACGGCGCGEDVPSELLRGLGANWVTATKVLKIGAWVVSSASRTGSTFVAASALR
jgi:hypothetical protein